jgi:hypothetical protein
MGAPSGRPRPLGVTIIGVLLLLLGLIILLAVNMVGTLDEIEGYETVIESVMLLFGVIYMLLAVGFLKGWAWIWTLTMAMLILGIVLDIASWIVGGGGLGDLLSTFIGLLLPIIILLYMSSAKVKTFFGK